MIASHLSASAEPQSIGQSGLSALVGCMYVEARRSAVHVTVRHYTADANGALSMLKAKHRRAPSPSDRDLFDRAI